MKQNIEIVADETKMARVKLISPLSDALVLNRFAVVRQVIGEPAKQFLHY